MRQLYIEYHHPLKERRKDINTTGPSALHFQPICLVGALNPFYTHLHQPNRGFGTGFSDITPACGQVKVPMVNTAHAQAVGFTWASYSMRLSVQCLRKAHQTSFIFNPCTTHVLTLNLMVSCCSHSSQGENSMHKANSKVGYTLSWL